MESWLKSGSKVLDHLLGQPHLPGADVQMGLFASDRRSFTGKTMRGNRTTSLREENHPISTLVTKTKSRMGTYQIFSVVLLSEESFL